MVRVDGEINCKLRKNVIHLMANNRQAQTQPRKAKERQLNLPDRRLSRLEVSVVAIAIICIVMYAAAFLNKQLTQNQAAHMANQAQAVADWIAAAHEVRKRNAGLFPERCQRNKAPLSSCFQNMVAPGQPFSGLRNINANEFATAAAFAFVPEPHLDLAQISCQNLPSSVFISAPLRVAEVRPDSWKGMVIVQPSTLMNDLSAVSNRLSVGYCDRQERLIWVVLSVAF